MILFFPKNTERKKRESGRRNKEEKKYIKNGKSKKEKKNSDKK